MTATPEEPNGERSNKDEIDAEFSKLMEGIGIDDSILDKNRETPPGGYAEPSSTHRPQAPYERGTIGGLTGPTPGHGSPEIPDDISSLNDSAPDEGPDAPRPLAVIATPLASAQALAGVIRLALAAEDDLVQLPQGTATVEAESGALVVGRLTEQDAHKVAHLASLGLQRQGIVMFWRSGDRMVAARYRYGRNEGETSPALVMGALSSEVEDLLLGIDQFEDIEESYDPSELTRAQALKFIATGRKKRR